MFDFKRERERDRERSVSEKEISSPWSNEYGLQRRFIVSTKKCLSLKLCQQWYVPIYNANRLYNNSQWLCIFESGVREVCFFVIP